MYHGDSGKTVPHQRSPFYNCFIIWAFKFNFMWKNCHYLKSLKNDFTVLQQVEAHEDGPGERGQFWTKMKLNTSEYGQHKEFQVWFSSEEIKIENLLKEDLAETNVYQSNTSETANVDNTRVPLKTFFHSPDLFSATSSSIICLSHTVLQHHYTWGRNRNLTKQVLQLTGEPRMWNTLHFHA